MEADSDDTSTSSSDGSSDVESEDSGSEDEASIMAEDWYESILEDLRDNAVADDHLAFDGGVLRVILQDVDQFSHVLVACTSRITSISIISDDDDDDDDGGLDSPRIDVTENNKQAWQTLCAAFGRLASVESVEMCDKAISYKAMTTIVKAMPTVEKLEFPTLNCFGTRSDDTECDDIIAFIEAISDHPCQDIELDLTRDEAPTGNNINTDDADMLTRFLSVHGLDTLSLDSFHLSLNECNVIASAISSNTCCAKSLTMFSLTFQDEEGGRILANAFQTNTRLKELEINFMLEQSDPFTNALAASLAQNKSIVTFTNGFLPEDGSSLLVNLITTIARQNTTMRHFCHCLALAVPSEEECLEIRQALQQNYTLEHVKIEESSISLDITRLNEAGRRYMLEDAASQSKCIAVLAKVKNDIDSLYFHFRENPILLTGGNAADSGVADCKKRKAEGTAKDDEGNRIKVRRTSRT